MPCVLRNPHEPLYPDSSPLKRLSYTNKDTMYIILQSSMCKRVIKHMNEYILIIYYYIYMYIYMLHECIQNVSIILSYYIYIYVCRYVYIKSHRYLFPTAMIRRRLVRRIGEASRPWTRPPCDGAVHLTPGWLNGIFTMKIWGFKCELTCDQWWLMVGWWWVRGANFCWGLFS